MFRTWEGLVSYLRRAFYDLRTEYTSAGREAAAIGVGVLIGCTPFYGLHLVMCWVVASLLRLNRVHMYLASNISNPVFAPLLLFSELQVGALIRHGTFQSLTLSAFRTTYVWSFGLDYLLGAAVVGTVLGTLAATVTYAALCGSARDPTFTALIQRASDRYVAISITAWEFARGKLRGDAVYRNVLCGALLPSGGELVDVGCGQGLMLTLLAEARSQAASGALPRDAAPQFDRLIGIESRPRVARLARTALGADAEILEGDARSVSTGSVRAVLFFDVLHMMPRDDQEDIVRSFAARLDPGGVILVRDADASGGWRFAPIWIFNRAKAFLSGAWRQEFHFRTKREWLECFARLGLCAEVCLAGDPMPFSNVLFRLTVLK